MASTLLNRQYNSVSSFLNEVRQIIESKALPGNYNEFQRTCEEVQVSIQLVATLLRDYVKISQEVFASALHVLSQQQQLENDLMELVVLRQKLEEQLDILKLSEEKNVKLLEVLNNLSTRLEQYRRDNHAISEQTLKLISRLDHDRDNLNNESDLMWELKRISREMSRFDQPFSSKLLTRLKRLEHHYAISQDVTAIQLLFSRMLMTKVNGGKQGEKSIFHKCVGGESDDPPVVKLLSRIVMIGTSLLTEVKQLEEINHLIRTRQELMYQEYMDRQSKTFSMLWDLQQITNELQDLSLKNDCLVGKLVKTRPQFDQLEDEVLAISPRPRSFSKRIIEMHPGIFYGQNIQPHDPTSSENEEFVKRTISNSDLEVPMMPQYQPNESKISDIVSDDRFDEASAKF